jgi:hypothetical protein
VLYQLKDRYRRFRFGQACRSILATPPCNVAPGSSVALLSQSQHKDVLLALIAIKSFVARVPVEVIYVLDDGSLTADDIALLKDHFPAVTVLELADFRGHALPRGGTWERLTAIAEVVKDRYVIQLDSDTLTLAALPEVTACLDRNSSFVIGTWDRQEFETMSSRQHQAAALVAKATGKVHIQLAAEANFDKLERFSELQYVRGCSGFSGFGKGSFDRSLLEEVSSQMLRALGDRWREWGSEQVMSNIVVANSALRQLLPHPRYCDCTKIIEKETIFIHFIGSCRFDRGIYGTKARTIIAELSV